MICDVATNDVITTKAVVGQSKIVCDARMLKGTATNLSACCILWSLLENQILSKVLTISFPSMIQSKPVQKIQQTTCWREHLVRCWVTKIFLWSIIQPFYGKKNVHINNRVEVLVLGEYCRIRPFVFSLAPHSHDEHGWAKYNLAFNALAIFLCWTNSLPMCEPCQHKPWATEWFL